MAIVFSLGIWPEGADDTVAADLSQKLKLKMGPKDTENGADKNMPWLSSYLVVLSVRLNDAIERAFKSGCKHNIHLMAIPSQ